MGSQPLFGQTSLQERDPCRNIGESVHPAGNLLARQDLAESTGEVIAVSTHEVVTVAAELFTEFLQDFFHVFASEIRVAKVDRLLEFELFSKFARVARRNVKDATERKGMASVSVLAAIHLQARMVHAETNIVGVFVGPEHVVDIDYHRFAGDLAVKRIHGFHCVLNLTAAMCTVVTGIAWKTLELTSH